MGPSLNPALGQLSKYTDLTICKNHSLILKCKDISSKDFTLCAESLDISVIKRLQTSSSMD